MDDLALKAKMDELIKKRDEFVIQANAQIAYLNGQIALCEEFLVPPKETETPKTD